MSRDFNRMLRSRCGASARTLLFIGTMLGGLSVPAQVRAEEIYYNGPGDYSLTRTDNVSGGPRVIDITATSGTIALDIAGTTVVNSGNAFGAGIAANNMGAGNVSIVSGALAASGTGQTFGIDAHTTSGNISLRARDTTLTGGSPYLFVSRAINAVSVSGTVTIVAGTTRSSSINAIYADGASVDVTSGTTSSGDIVSPGSFGGAIIVKAGVGGAVVNATSTMFGGESGAGILVNSVGTARIDSGNIMGSGLYARGIVTYGSGDAVIRSGAITLSDGYGGRAIQADARLGGSVDIESGAITTALASGIYTSATGGATRIVSGSIITTDAFAGGIDASSRTGTINIASGKIETLGYSATGIAITGFSGQTGATAITSQDLRTRGFSAPGINAGSAGAITIDSKELQTDGDGSTGIAAGSSGDVTIKSERLTTNGAAAVGISAQSGGGNIAITAGTTSTTFSEPSFRGPNHAIYTRADGEGSTTTISSTSASTAGARSYAILATGDGAINITSTRASTTGDGASAIYAGSHKSNIVINASTTTTGGLGANAVEGSALGDVTVNAGTAAAADGRGIIVTAGRIATVTASTVSARGSGNAGILAQGGTGVVLNIGSATSNGASTNTSEFDLHRGDAVYAQSSYGAAKIVVGSATASGAGADAIRVIANGTAGTAPDQLAGSATLTISGAVAAANGNGVFVQTSGAGAITVAEGGRVAGTAAGINLASTAGSIVNLGTIVGTTGRAIVASGPTNIDNRGTIEGDVALGDSGDRFATLTSSRLTGRIDGGAGTDALILDRSGSTASSTAFDLARFANFESLTVTGTGNLTLAGTLAFPTVQMDGGRLDVAAGTTLSTSSAVTITGSAAAETVVNRGIIAGGVDLGAGNDRFENRGSLRGSLALGDGDDTYAAYGGSSFASAAGGAGTDTIELHSTGTDSSPAPFDQARFNGFERLLQQEGATAFGGSISFQEVQVVGGRLIGLVGSTVNAPTITVAQGATFGSAGTINGNVAVSGTLNPGASPGTMTVVGNVSLAAGSDMLVELSPTVSDRLNISGALTIAGGATLTLTGSRPLTPGAPLDLIVADGGITGSFTTVRQPSTILGFLRQSGNAIQLYGQFANAGFTPQVTSAIDYVNAVLVSGPTSAGLIAAVPSLLTAGNTTNGAAFARLTPEPYASATAISVENGLTLAKAARSGVGAGDPGEVGAFTFAQGLGGWRSLNGDSVRGTSRAEVDSYGLLGGIGFGTSFASLAAFVGYLDSRQRMSVLDAHTDADGLVGGLIGHAAAGGFELSALVAYDGGEAYTRRALPGGATASSRYNLHGWVSDTSFSYMLPLNGNWSLKPEAGLTYVATRRAGGTESGGGPFSLAVVRRRSHATFVDGALTLRGGTASGATFHPWASAGVRRQLAGQGTFAAGSFAGAPGSFSVLGVRRQTTLATAGAGVSAELTPALALFTSYRGEFGRDGTGANLTGGLRLRF